MIFDKANWNRFAHGFSISRCAIADGNRYTFVMVGHPNRKDPDTHPLTRFLHVWANDPMDKRFGFAEGTFFYSHAAYRYEKELNYELVTVDVDGAVYVRSDQRNSKEREKSDLSVATKWTTRAGEVYNRSSLKRVKRINGEIVVSGLDHHLFRRKGPGQWEPFPGMDRPKQLFEQAPEYDSKRKFHPQPYSSLDFGFQDISAFGPNDIYAVGGHGDVWRFDGHEWSQCDFPSNEPLHTVCCAGDGKVYITGRDASVWVGREDTWKPLIPGERRLEFKDSAWFAGRMWFGMDYGLFELKGDQIELVDFPDETFGRGMMAGCLDVSIDGKHMLTAGTSGAALFDGKTWEPLFNASFFEPEMFEDEDDDE